MLEETKEHTLTDIVIELHNMARIIEQEVGRGNLSDDIRNCADRVSLLLSKRTA